MHTNAQLYRYYGGSTSVTSGNGAGLIAGGGVGAAPAGGRRRRSTFDPDEKWSNLYREREKNNLYKWVGVRNGGELITIYEKEGEEGVLKFALEKFEPMMYNGGKFTQLIKYADYVRWKKTIHTVFGIPEEVQFSEADTKFREHEAQWRLNKRGVEGESIIHLLLNREEPMCSEIARILVTRYPGLAKDIYLGDDMFGQSALHLAIVHDDYDTVQLLLEQGAEVNAQASGDFFLPENQDTTDHKAMDYKGYAYYGEYPLAFAACFENKDIYDLLIQYGADPDLQDVYGNTCLHMCVINYSNSMYSYAVRHWQKPAHSNIVNHAGYTPLTLATKLGRKQIFEEMLELMKVEFWRFSDMTCSAYPLDTLDTIRPDGSTNYDSALMTVINGRTPEHLEMIGSEVIQRLLADKWKAFASRKLFERLALLVFHLICLSFAVYLRPTELERLYMAEPRWNDYARTVFEILVILSCCWFVFIQQLDELRTQGFYGYIRNLVTAPAKVVFFLANLCLLFCVPFRLLRIYSIEESLFVFALPGSWIFLLFFARSAKLTGPFVQMIYSMIAGDMIRFAIISAIFLVSFSQVFYFVGKDISKKQTLPKNHIDNCPIDGYQIKTYSSYLETFVTLFRASMGGYDYEEFQCTNYAPLTKTLFVFYMFIMPIMMINILIAMMGNTYTTVITQAEKAWRQQYAQIVMVLERSMNRQRLVTCQLEYSIRLNDPERETRGLMVIKQTKKTKARQRKQAINNWKRIGRKVIMMVKEMGGDHTKFLLHSHDRIIDEPAVIGPAGAGGPAASGAAAATVSGMDSVTGGGGSRGNVRLYSNMATAAGGGNADDGGGPLGSDTARQRAGSSHALGAVVVAARFRERRGGATPPGGEMRRVESGDAVDAGQPPHKMNGDLPTMGRHLSSTHGGYRRASPPQLNFYSPPGYHHVNHYVHVTQRALPAAAGSRVRGVEMLPSVDVPNIPSALPNLSPASIFVPPLRVDSSDSASPRIVGRPAPPRRHNTNDSMLVGPSDRDHHRRTATNVEIQLTTLRSGGLQEMTNGMARTTATAFGATNSPSITTGHSETSEVAGLSKQSGTSAVFGGLSAPSGLLGAQRRVPGVKSDTFQKKDHDGKSSGHSSTSSSTKTDPGRL